MITARAVGFLLVAVFLFFLGGATNVGWVRIVDSVLWGMLGLSLLLQWLSVAALVARRRLLRAHHSEGLPSPMEDDVVEVELELKNLRFWPRFFVSLSYEAPMESPDLRWQRFFVANLRSHGTVKLTRSVRCHRRGLHPFGPVSIESQVPFGLFRRRRRKAAPLSLLVYPRAYPMNRLALIEGTHGLSATLRRARTGQEVIGSRQYNPGDPMRHIHWRNTARLGKLAIKEMEDTAERALTIAFDVQRSLGEGRESTLEYSIKLAATVGLHALLSGESVRLVAGNLRGEWGEAKPFLHELALLETSTTPHMAFQLQTVPSSSPILAIVAAADHEAADALKQSLPRLPGLTAVVLEGFVTGDAESGLAQQLQGAGIPTLVCQRGKLAESIGALEDLSHTPGAAIG